MWKDDVRGMIGSRDGHYLPSGIVGVREYLLVSLNVRCGGVIRRIARGPLFSFSLIHANVVDEHGGRKVERVEVDTLEACACGEIVSTKAIDGQSDMRTRLERCQS